MAFFAFVLSFLSIITMGIANSNEEFSVLCYYSDWAYYRSGEKIGSFKPSDIDDSLCTHIIYTFAVYNENLNTIQPANPELAVGLGFYKRVTAFKKKGKKVILAVGGWGDSVEKYHNMLKNSNLRSNFAKGCVDFVVKHDFDGLDVDLEYPGAWQGEIKREYASDKKNFASFLKELRAAFDANSNKYYSLSAAVSASKRIINVAYDVATMSRVLDWIGVMTYDLHGKWDKRTGIHSTFTAQPNEYADSVDLNVKRVMKIWLEEGAPREKLVVGFPLYGRSFHLYNPVARSGRGINAPISGDAVKGESTDESGFLAFYEIINRVNNMGWTLVRKPNVGSYAYHLYSKQWVGFDTQKDVRRKADYVVQNRFKGAMVWAIDLDDYKNAYSCGKYPLLSTLNAALKGQSVLKSTCHL